MLHLDNNTERVDELISSMRGFTIRSSRLTPSLRSTPEGADSVVDVRAAILMYFSDSADSGAQSRTTAVP